LFSLSGFANLSTKITTQREFRFSLFLLLSKNNQRFQSSKIKCQLFEVNKSVITSRSLTNLIKIPGLRSAIRQNACFSAAMALQQRRKRKHLLF